MANDNPTFTIKEAIKKIKSEKKRNFDQTIELHINLDLDPKKQDEQIRYTTVLPNGTGQEKVVAVMASKKFDGADLDLTEADLKKIESGDLRPGRDFDVIVAEPSEMGKLAKVARVLGPAGVMPNPKNGTVTKDVDKAIEQIKKGKVEVKTEQVLPIIHTIIGKHSFEDKQLIENYDEIMKTLKSNRPQKVDPDFVKSAFLTASMGKSYQIALEA